MVWIVGPILAVILFFFLVILICVLKRRKQNPKQPLQDGQGVGVAGQQASTPLMSGFEMNQAQVVAMGNGNNGMNGGGGQMMAANGAGGQMMANGAGGHMMNGGGMVHLQDPVELRRMNFQTPGKKNM